MNPKERIQAAFENARILSEIKKSVLLEFDSISGFLQEITGGKIELGYAKCTNREYSTDTSVYIKPIEGKNVKEDIHLFSYSIDNIKGYPVLVEDDDSFEHINEPETLKEYIVNKVTDDEIMAKILQLVEKIDSYREDIPF